MRLRRAAAIAAVLAAFTATSVAEAAQIARFRVRDTGRFLTFTTRVCTNHSAFVRFVMYITAERNGVSYTASAYGRQGRGCTTWIPQMYDRYAEGVWYGQVRVLVGSQSLLSPERVFYIR